MLEQKVRLPGYYFRDSTSCLNGCGTKAPFTRRRHLLKPTTVGNGTLDKARLSKAPWEPRVSLKTAVGVPYPPKESKITAIYNRVFTLTLTFLFFLPTPSQVPVQFKFNLLRENSNGAAVTVPPRTAERPRRRTRSPLSIKYSQAEPRAAADSKP